MPQKVSLLGILLTEDEDEFVFLGEKCLRKRREKKTNTLKEHLMTDINLIPI